MTRRDRIWEVKNATELFEDQVSSVLFLKTSLRSDLTEPFGTALPGWVCDTADQKIFQIHIHLLHTKVPFSPKLLLCQLPELVNITKGRLPIKKNVYFRALPKLALPPPPLNSGNLVLFFRTSKTTYCAYDKKNIDDNDDG